MRYLNPRPLSLTPDREMQLPKQHRPSTFSQLSQSEFVRNLLYHPSSKPAPPPVFPLSVNGIAVHPVGLSPETWA